MPADDRRSRGDAAVTGGATTAATSEDRSTRALAVLRAAVEDGTAAAAAYPAILGPALADAAAGPVGDDAFTGAVPPQRRPWERARALVRALLTRARHEPRRRAAGGKS